VSRLKLAVLLPITQLAIAASLLQWSYRIPHPQGVELYSPTPWLICFGLNAPALIFRAVSPAMWGEEYRWFPASIAGFYSDEFFFLVGVILVWYLVGRTLDRRSSPRENTNPTFTTAIGATLLLALGGILFTSALHLFMFPGNDNPYHPVRTCLTFAWAVVIIFVSGRRLVRQMPKLLVRQKNSWVDSGSGNLPSE
jgi:hypothetical protein